MPNIHGGRARTLPEIPTHFSPNCHFPTPAPEKVEWSKLQSYGAADCPWCVGHLCQGNGASLRQGGPSPRCQLFLLSSFDGLSANSFLNSGFCCCFLSADSVFVILVILVFEKSMFDRFVNFEKLRCESFLS